VDARIVKILLVLASPEYLRFFDSTIALLAGRGHQTHLVVDEAAEYKPVGLSGTAALPLASVSVIAPARTFWSDTAKAFRAVVDVARFLHPDYAHAAVLRERIRRKVLPAGLGWLGAARRMPAGALDALLRFLRVCERALPVDPRIRRTLAATSPDLVLVSPLVEAASPQVDWIKGARQQGIPAAVAVASWDNLTNKGLMRVVPDRVFVWNEIQRQEAARYHAIPAERIAVTGAAVFDRWFGRQPSRARDAFCDQVGFGDARPFVLFTGSSSFIADGADEIAFVRSWIRALRASTDPAVRALGVLVRPHPYNTEAWRHADLGDTAARVWPRGRFNPAGEDGRRDFFDSLHHAAAIVGINTSAMIEAAIVGRPVLTIDAFATQQGTLHFQYLLQENGGPVSHAATLEAHVAQLAAAVKGQPAADAFVRAFVRPHGLDEPSTPHLVQAIEEAAALRPPPRSDAAAAVLLRPAMAAFGAWVITVARLTSSDPFAPVRKNVLHPWRAARRQAARQVQRLRERTVRSARLGANRMRRVEHVVRANMRRGPGAWKRVRRALRQARYAAGMMRRQGTPSRRSGRPGGVS
jgi:hypothetical protein